MTNTDMPLIREIPEKKVPNYFFKNNGNLTFTNISTQWIRTEPSFSNGCTFADLDNDGDLDIVVNNIDQELYILENGLKASNYLKIGLLGPDLNKFGLGAKVYVYAQSGNQVLEHYTGNGYLSSSSNELLFGLGKDKLIDSIKVIWPDDREETLFQVSTNRKIELKHKNSNLKNSKLNPQKPNFGHIVKPFSKFIHSEKPSLDFSREPLIPFANSNEGPTISVADLNKDGLDDFFIGGAKAQASHVYLQQESGEFQDSQTALFEEEMMSEDVASVFFDANGDDDIDLLVASGGNEFSKGKPLTPRLYLNYNGVFIRDTTAFQDIEINASKIIVNDFDADGDYDLVIASDQIPAKYGKSPAQFFLLNQGNGKFIDATETVIPELKNIGNIKDMSWADVNGDNIDDLIVVGHWMPISVFINSGKEFRLQNSDELKKTNGLWNSILTVDVDNDGDQDLVCGNWGTNTKLQASLQQPMTLYNYDFDNNGQTDPLVTYFHKNTETPFASKDELVKQMPYLNKSFLSYKDFAAASIEDLFGKDALDNSEKKYVYELQSSIFINDGTGHFSKQHLPIIAQISSINDIISEDFDSDGFKDLLIVGNNFEISTQLGRLDALHGLILYNSQNRSEPFQTHYEMLQLDGASREIHKMKIKNLQTYLIGRNNDSPLFFIYNN